ncbi:MAG: bacteriocin, lactococcin 972 family protein [Streptococcaceae bacterium]|jgi:hypothetical protein|nr:bacteriocin, lactococcin 972 family protein [Streptococcaceae bacterium]
MSIKKILATATIALTLLSGGASLTTTTAHAGTSGFAQPHPYILDYWYYGVQDNGWAYSHYEITASYLGSKSSVTDSFGNVKSRASADYGYDNSGAYKQWYWGTANAHYGWYNL